MEIVESYKYLGVVISSDLSWTPHIQASANMYESKKDPRAALPKYRYVSDSSTLLKMYKTLTRPHLEYAAQVWSPL